MAKRKSLTKKIRFEVFKRDSFTCQYCGRSAPDVVLQVDHIQPVVEGGDNDLTNLITSCVDCNQGKGKRKLSDQSVLEKQKAQLKELNERRIQLEMMMEWRKELLNLKEQEVNAVADYFSKLTNYCLTDHGWAKVRKWLEKYSLKEILNAVERSASQYLERDEEGKPTPDSAGKVFDYIPKICSCNRLTAEKPHIKELFYIRGILRNRLNYVNERLALQWLEGLYYLLADDLDSVDQRAIDEIKRVALSVRNWTEFRTYCEDMLGED